MDRTENKSGAPRFQVGDKVRVKPGVPDPEFPDIPWVAGPGRLKKLSKLEISSPI